MSGRQSHHRKANGTQPANKVQRQRIDLNQWLKPADDGKTSSLARLENRHRMLANNVSVGDISHVPIVAKICINHIRKAFPDIHLYAKEQCEWNKMTETDKASKKESIRQDDKAKRKLRAVLRAEKTLKQMNAFHDYETHSPSEHKTGEKTYVDGQIKLLQSRLEYWTLILMVSSGEHAFLNHGNFRAIVETIEKACEGGNVGVERVYDKLHETYHANDNSGAKVHPYPHPEQHSASETAHSRPHLHPEEHIHPPPVRGGSRMGSMAYDDAKRTLLSRTGARF